MLTPEGAAWLWRRAAEGGGWKLAVTDGTSRAEAPATTHDVAPTDDGATITLTAVFGSDEANFTWARREVIAPDGTVIDSTEEDGGRKAPGSIWSIEAVIEIEADEGDDEGSR